MTIIRFGIVGAGSISASHAKALHNNSRAELIAVCDLDADRAAQLAQSYGVSRIFRDLNELLRSREIDAVCICLPSGLHEQAVVACAQAGKHILCEKPLDIALDKIDRMIAAAENNRVKLGCVYQRRTMPEAIAARQAIREGKLGRMVLGDAYMKYYRGPDYYRSSGWRGTWEHDGGGALMNQGVHGIDLLQWMMGDIASVFAHSATLVREIEVEDTAVVAVKFKSGALGVIQGATSVYPGQDTRFELHGENGSILFSDKGILSWEQLNGSLDLPVIGKEMPPGESRSITYQGHVVMIDDMIDAILEDREPMVNGSEARKAVAVIMAIYESSRTGEQIFL